MSIEITVNGEPRSFEQPLSVARLVELLRLKPMGVAVELNREIVPRSRWKAQEIAAGDRIEIVTFVGGG